MPYEAHSMEPTDVLMAVMVMLLILGIIAGGSLLWDRYRQRDDQS